MARQLLVYYGRDCAGAVQFLDPSDACEAGAQGPTRWLTDRDIGAQLRAMNADPASWTFAGSEGRFSLAGAQAKFALVRQGDRWGRPSGSAATTHIIKPGIPEFRESALNEHAEIGAPQWHAQAASLGLDGARFVETVRTLIAGAPAQISSLCASPDVVSIDAEFARVLESALLRRVADAGRSVGSPNPGEGAAE